MISDLEKLEEAEILRAVITHPAGFCINMFHDVLGIRPHTDGYEVNWNINETDTGYVDFTNAMDACVFFVNKRIELEIGVDFWTLNET
jgi:hypothetical protein